MFHVAKVTMENGETKVPRALAGSHVSLDTTGAAGVQIDVPMSDVVGYVRAGNDLVIQLKNGEVIVLADYFDDSNNDVPTLEILNANGEYVPVEFGTSAASDGVLSPTFGVAGLAGAVGGIGAAGMAGLVGLGALALGSVVVAASSGGGGKNDGGGNGGYVPQPQISQYGPDGMSGTGKPGDTITIHNETTGQDMGSVVVPDDGHWSITFDPKPGPNDHLTVIETSPGGGSSEPVDLTPGGVRPEAPEIDQYGPDNISGTGKPGDTITVTNETTGKVIGQTVVGDDGTWSITPDPKPGNGDHIEVVESDPNGYDSPGTGITIGENRPAAPEIGQYGPDSISGTGTPGNTVTVTDETTGQVVGQTVVGDDGTWSVMPNPKPGNGDKVTAVESDKNGNDSQGSDVTIGANRPEAPEIDQYGPDSISGTGTPGDTVTVTDETTGQVIGKGVVGEDGKWSITPNPKPANGDQVTAVQSDANGNDSLGSDVTIGANRPDAPDAHQDGATLMGTGTPGDTITILDKTTGQVVGKATVGNDGKWSTTLSPEPGNNDALAVTQSDKNGNDSQPDTVAWDAIAPASATVAASNGTSISGLAEPGTTVTIKWAGGEETVQVAGDGFTYKFPSQLADGSAVTVTLKDPAGNASKPVTVVTDTDGNGSGVGAAAMPAAPSISASNGTVVSGTAPLGTTVMLDLNGDGTSDASVVTKPDGTWSYTPTTPLADGTAVTAWTQDSDATPQVSSKQTVTVDAAVPDAPVFFLKNGLIAEGTASPGSIVSIDATGDGVADFTVTAGADGTWEQTVFTRSDGNEGKEVHAWATNPETGAMSGHISQIADSTSSVQPQITTLRIGGVSGTVTEPFATVTIDYTTDGKHDFTTVADENGNWSFTDPALVPGTIVNVWATDGSQNKSSVVSDVVGHIAPTLLDPVYSDEYSSFSVQVVGDLNGDNALNASEIDANRTISFTGKADPNQNIILSYFAPDNKVHYLGVVKADASGNWSFPFETDVADGKIHFIFSPDGGEPIGLDVVIDTVAPVITDTTYSDDTGAAPDRLTNDATPTFAGQVSEKATVEAVIDGNKAVSVESNTDGGWTVGPLATLADGAHTVRYFATDIYGNTSTAYVDAPLTIDTVNADTVAISSVNTARVALVTGNVTGHESTHIRLVVDGRTDQASTIPVHADGTWSGYVDTQVLQAGHTLVATGIDDAGNLTTAATRIFSNAPPPAPPPTPTNPWPMTGANGETFVHDGKTWTWWYTPWNDQVGAYEGVWTSLPPAGVNVVGFKPGANSPLAIDLSENGHIDTVSREDGVLFDVNNDGFFERISWFSNGDGLLVLDKNGNGIVDNGTELFGPTEKYSDGSLINDGYIEISAYDLNGDKVIDQNDRIFEYLQVWVDENMDGRTDDGELFSLADLGITSISIDPTDLDYTDDAGVYHKNASVVQFEDGHTQVMEDVYFEASWTRLTTDGDLIEIANVI